MFHENTFLRIIRTTPDDSEIGYTVEVDKKYAGKMKQKRKFFPSFLESKKFTIHRLLGKCFAIKLSTCKKSYSVIKLMKEITCVKRETPIFM